MTTPDHEPLLELRDLCVGVRVGGIEAAVVDGVSISVSARERVALVGESGSGKSMSGRASMALLPKGARVIGGSVLYRGTDIADHGAAQLRALRGRDIAMVFQDPMTFLNPTMRIGKQIGESVKLHDPRCDVRERVREVLGLVGLSSIPDVERSYPFQLSGGMRQRALMAIALACRPQLLIADEPTTALDVTVQAQVLSTLATLTEQLSMALLLITHDLGIVASLCDRVYVMYAGQIVEHADTESLFDTPAHPYTRGLLDGLLTIDHAQDILKPIPGSVPDFSAMPRGCRFRERCPDAMSRCAEDPPLFRSSSGQESRCWLHATATDGFDWRPVTLRSGRAEEGVRTP